MNKSLIVFFVAGFGISGANPVSAINKSVRNRQPNVILIDENIGWRSIFRQRVAKASSLCSQA